MPLPMRMRYRRSERRRYAGLCRAVRSRGVCSRARTNEPLRTARRAFYAGMVALTDALRAYAPPNKPVTIDWPDAIRIDGGLVGGGRLGWPSSAKEDEPPPWLVFGAMIRTVAMTDEEPGVHPLASALEQEGFGEAGAVQVTESFARHLMLRYRRLAGRRIRRRGARISEPAFA